MKSIKLICSPDNQNQIEYFVELVTGYNWTTRSGNSAVNVLIVFRRKSLFHVINTFLQTFLLQSIGYLTLFFELEDFSDRIMVTLTTMLVIATFMASIQAIRGLSRAAGVIVV